MLTCMVLDIVLDVVVDMVVDMVLDMLVEMVLDMLVVDMVLDMLVVVLVRGGLGGCSVLKEAAAACWLFHNGEEFRAFCKRPEHL